ncbi:MAG: hypothetical protein SF053_12750 [Bacteroidia bacterium]|nr:hypothetical protein [Bacteroidia bacterium]
MNHLTSRLLQDTARGWLLASDKVYAVMAVMILILGLLTGLMLLTARRLSALEKQVESLEKSES